jgi:hypothetical protein
MLVLIHNLLCETISKFSFLPSLLENSYIFEISEMTTMHNHAPAIIDEL